MKINNVHENVDFSQKCELLGSLVILIVRKLSQIVVINDQNILKLLNNEMNNKQLVK